MRRIRAAIIMASIGLGLLVSPASPAQAAASVSRPALSSPYQFGVYYTLDACQFFGNSLVRGGAFTSYYCALGYYPGDGQYHWYLYVY